jgi:hypothetical protein
MHHLHCLFFWRSGYAGAPIDLRMPLRNGRTSVTVPVCWQKGANADVNIARASYYCGFVTAWCRCALTGLYGSLLRDTLRSRTRELKGAYLRISELAETDELTGTFNRRKILSVLDDEIVRAMRSGLPCCVAIYRSRPLQAHQ